MHLGETHAMKLFDKVCIFIQSNVIVQKQFMNSGDLGSPRKWLRGVTGHVFGLTLAGPGGSMRPP